MIEMFRLQHVASLPAGNLSYGQQKLIDIAMAFMPAPRLVLLDEPCAGVNPSLVEQLRELLLQLNKTQGGSFVVIDAHTNATVGAGMIVRERHVRRAASPEERRTAVLNVWHDEAVDALRKAGFEVVLQP